MKHKPIQLTAAAHLVTASAEGRTISGTITLLEKLSDDRRVIFKAGSLTPREPIKRVKLLVDHDMSQPVGYMATYAQAGNKLDASFYVPEGDAGDAALADAASGRRDGFSVGVTLYEYDFNDKGNLIVENGQIHEVSLCAIPAFQDAQVESVAAALAATRKDVMTPEEIAAKAAADAAADAAAAAQQSTNTTTETSAGTPTPAVVQLQTDGERQPPARHFTEPRGISLAQAATTVSAAMATGDPLQIRAALADILPTADAGKGWLRDDWVGEIWQASKVDRAWIDALGPVKQLTSMKIKGWRWGTKPKPAKWAGNKTEVPTGPATTVPWESEAGRWAGGWDIDRIFIDLGEAGFLESFWNAAIAEYRAASNADIGAQMLAGATSKPAAAGVLAGLRATARDLRSIGATASTIFLGEEVFDEYADLKQSEVPFWLANATGVNIANDTADVAQLHIAVNEDLADREIVGFDKRAADVHEKTPIKLQAFDIAKGGIDLGFFSYGGLAIYDPRAIVKRTVTAAPAE